MTGDFNPYASPQPILQRQPVGAEPTVSGTDMEFEVAIDREVVEAICQRDPTRKLAYAISFFALFVAWFHPAFVDMPPYLKPNELGTLLAFIVLLVTTFVVVVAFFAGAPLVWKRVPELHTPYHVKWTEEFVTVTFRHFQLCFRTDAKPRNLTHTGVTWFFHFTTPSIKPVNSWVVIPFQSAGERWREIEHVVNNRSALNNSIATSSKWRLDKRVGGWIGVPPPADAILVNNVGEMVSCRFQAADKISHPLFGTAALACAALLITGLANSWFGRLGQFEPRPFLLVMSLFALIFGLRWLWQAWLVRRGAPFGIGGRYGLSALTQDEIWVGATDATFVFPIKDSVEKVTIQNAGVEVLLKLPWNTSLFFAKRATQSSEAWEELLERLTKATSGD